MWHLPSMSPCSVINPKQYLLTYLIVCCYIHPSTWPKEQHDYVLGCHRFYENDILIIIIVALVAVMPHEDPRHNLPPYILSMSVYFQSMWRTPKHYAPDSLFGVPCCGNAIGHLPISFKVASLALRETYDCSRATEEALTNMICELHKYPEI